MVRYNTIEISIHAPLAGCDLRCEHDAADAGGFQSTHPLRGATLLVYRAFHQLNDFNPRTPCGARRVSCAVFCHVFYFNPRTPCGARPSSAAHVHHVTQISIHAPLAGRDVIKANSAAKNGISIHAPLAGRDDVANTLINIERNFNPRTPCGVRLMSAAPRLSTGKFQSTHPLRGATEDDVMRYNSINISIHAPLAGCDAEDYVTRKEFDISIHAPLAGCDLLRASQRLRSIQFQSTHPLRGATGSAK